MQHRQHISAIKEKLSKYINNTNIYFDKELTIMHMVYDDDVCEQLEPLGAKTTASAVSFRSRGSFHLRSV